KVKWAAELAHVREVSLLGTADLPFWQGRLEAEGLRPAARDGRAAVLLIAADARFMGIRFREMSVSVQVVPPEGGALRDAAYLVGAFNSSRLLAFCERVFFSTPYRHGDVHLSASLPASIRVADKGGAGFRAEMGTGTPGEPAAEGW